MENVMTPAGSVKEKELIQLATALGPRINQHIQEEEDNGRLSPAVIEALREAGFFKLFLPKSLGGLEADPLTTAKVVEEVARHNTAAGWSLMVANTLLPMGGHIPEKGIDELFGNKTDVIFAGSIHPPMRATEVKGGLLINGRSPLVSNVHEAEWIFVTALIMEGEQPKIVNGHPVVVGAIFRAENCKIIDTWYTIGMRATDSNDIEVKDVLVPEHLYFVLVPEYEHGRHFQGPLYKFPAAGVNIGCLLTPVSLAVASNAIDELKALADKKTPLGSRVPIRERGVVQRKLGQAVALVQSGRAFLHGKLAETWDKLLSGKTISLEEKAVLLLAATHANQNCVEAVELVYSAAGTYGIYTRNKLAHYFSDAQVLRQHGFMNESRYETAAQILFGLPTDLPIIEF